MKGFDPDSEFGRYGLGKITDVALINPGDDWYNRVHVVVNCNQKGE